jgi:UDP-N-acetylmuramate dehydrogenase
MAGCFFKNPVPKAAWQLIRDAKIEDTQNVEVSKVHANFLINKGNASAEEIENFAKLVQRKVYENSQIMLTMEVEII